MAVMLCFSSNDKNPGVDCPLKQSKIARAGCDLSSSKVALFASRKGTMIFSTYRFMVSSLDQWLSLCQRSQPDA